MTVRPDVSAAMPTMKPPGPHLTGGLSRKTQDPLPSAAVLDDARAAALAARLNYSAWAAGPLAMSA